MNILRRALLPFSDNTTRFVFQHSSGGLIKNLAIQILCALILVCNVGRAQTQLDTTLFAGMKGRSMGPAGIRGRIGGIDAVVSSPDIIYVNSVAIFQPIPATIWVETGEGNARYSAGAGNRVWTADRHGAILKAKPLI